MSLLLLLRAGQTLAAPDPQAPGSPPAAARRRVEVMTPAGGATEEVVAALVDEVIEDAVSPPDPVVEAGMETYDEFLDVREKMEAAF